MSLNFFFYRMHSRAETLSRLAVSKAFRTFLNDNTDDHCKENEWGEWSIDRLCPGFSIGLMGITQILLIFVNFGGNTGK